MCLLTLYETPDVAEEDIIAYKTFLFDENFLVYTPYQQYYPKFNIKLTAKGRMVPKKELVGFSYGEGGFHSFALLEDAKNDLRKCCWPVPSWVALKCIIPKGTWYVKGVFEKQFSYISKHLIVTKEIIAFSNWDNSITEEEFKKHLELC